MGWSIAHRVAALACVSLMLAAIALPLEDLFGLDSARAQAQPTPGPGSIILLPPPVPGLDYSPPETDQASIPEVAATTGTPVPVAGDAPASGESITATLGGSDIAVSSVGGSYERDVPKNRRGGRDSRK
jgi:hypothetical protein